ncbi:MAG: hypothetical protein L0Z55_02740 [Planctomycetes bacterium]|nr:hypothetical protein [Planctomycetota bacterium]
MHARAICLFGAGMVAGILLWGLVPRAAALSVPELPVSSGDTEGGSTVVVGEPGTSPNSETIYIWDHGRQRLAIYHIQGNTLELRHVRNCEYDFQLTDFSSPGGSAKPSVKEVKEAVK